MCGRYGFSIDEQEIRRIVREVEQSGAEVKTGEIFPGNTVPILIAPGGSPRLVPAVWGLQNPWRRGLSSTQGRKRRHKSPCSGGFCAGSGAWCRPAGFTSGLTMKPMSAVTAASRGSLSPGWRGFMTGERGCPGLPSSQLPPISPLPPSTTGCLW